jgi:hypothetical protein
MQVALWTCSGAPIRPSACFHALDADFLSLGILGVLNVVGRFQMVVAVALPGGMSSNVSEKVNFYIHHPIGYLTEREVCFTAPSM